MAQSPRASRGLSRVVLALSIISLVFVLISGAVAGFVSTTLLCFDVCPQTTSEWISVLTVGGELLLPALAFTLITWIVALWYTASGGTPRQLGVVVLTPLLLAAIITALELTFLNTGLAPTNTSKVQLWPLLALIFVLLLLIWPLSILMSRRRRSPTTYGV